MSFIVPTNEDERGHFGRRLIEHANFLRDQHSSVTAHVLEAYQEAIDLLSAGSYSEISFIRDDLASAWTNRGIALVRPGEYFDIAQAVNCFDAAIALRVPLLATGNPWFRYNLIGVWLNRGDAQLLRCGYTAFADAIKSYEEAIQTADGIDLGVDDDFPRRVALAHLNRGSTMLKIPEADISSAWRSFDSAIAVISRVGDSKLKFDRLIEAAAWVGRADALKKMGATIESRVSSGKAVRLVPDYELEDRNAVVIGLRARLLFCSSCIQDLLQAERSTSGESAILEAIDAAEEGLSVARQWPNDDVLEPLVRQLFQFASSTYAARQPKFLLEFIQDFLLPAEMSLRNPKGKIAFQAILSAISHVSTTGFLLIGRPNLNETIADLRKLRLAKEQFECEMTDEILAS